MGSELLKDSISSLCLSVASPLFHLFTHTPHGHNPIANICVLSSYYEKKHVQNGRIDFVVYIGAFKKANCCITNLLRKCNPKDN